MRNPKLKIVTLRTYAGMPITDNSNAFITIEAANDYIYAQAESTIEARGLAAKYEGLRQGQPRSQETTRVFLELVKSLYIAGKLSRDEYVFYFDFQVEHIVMELEFTGKYPELTAIDLQLDLLRDSHHFDVTTQDWPNGSEPSGFSELSSEYGVAFERRYFEALAEAGAQDLADLWVSDRSEYDASRERGRRKFAEPDRKIEALKELVSTYELEAQKCSQAGAYFAALTMIGSATESRLLIRMLGCDTTLFQVGVLNGRRPLSKDPLDWNFDALVKVALNAGWIQGLETQVDHAKTDGLASWIRKYRNCVHPARFIKDRGFASIGSHEYEQVEASYVLLKEALS